MKTVLRAGHNGNRLAASPTRKACQTYQARRKRCQVRQPWNMTASTVGSPGSATDKADTRPHWCRGPPRSSKVAAKHPRPTSSPTWRARLNRAAVHHRTRCPGVTAICMSPLAASAWNCSQGPQGICRANALAAPRKAAHAAAHRRTRAQSAVPLSLIHLCLLLPLSALSSRHVRAVEKKKQ